MTALSTLKPIPPAARGEVLVDMVLPVFNEAHVLEASVDRLHRYLDATFTFPWRITIVDNASTDDTMAVAERLSAAHPQVDAVHLDAKGRGRALRAAWSVLGGCTAPGCVAASNVSSSRGSTTGW